MPFKSLGLTEKILRAVSAMGYVDPTPIQLRAIPLVLAGHDVIGSAQTGTGKTAAFALPILSKLDQHEAQSARARARTHARTGRAGRNRLSRFRPIHQPERGRRSTAASVTAGKTRRSNAAWTSSSPRPAGCSTTSNAAPAGSTTSNTSCSTKPTGCSTWASCPTCAASSKAARATATPRCSPPPSRRRSKRSSNGR